MDRQNAAPELEPLRFGELIDAGFRLWRKGFKQLFIIAAIITVPIGVIAYLLQRGEVMSITPEGLLLVRDLGRYQTTAWTLTVLSFGGSFLSAGAVLVITTRAYIGSVPPWRDAFRIAINRVFPFVGLTIMVGLAVVAGLLVFVIPGIIILLGMSFATVAFWAEGARPTASIRRSWQLARGRRWPLFGLWAVSFVVFFVTGLVVTLPIVATLTGRTELYLLTENVGGAVVNALVAPLSSCLLTAAYYDARVRREGFDLQLAASRLDEDPDDPDDPVPPIYR